MICLNSWMREEPLDETIERLGRLGYDGVELFNPPRRPLDARTVAPMLDRNGVRCCAAAALMTGDRDLLHPDPHLRAGAVDYLKDTVVLVSALGGSVVTVAPGAEGRLAPRAAPSDEWRWCVAALRQCQELAGSSGVRIGVEPVCRFETYFVNRAEQALALAEEVGNGCGVVLDAFHMNIEEPDPVAAVTGVGAQLVNFHVADSNRLPPGRGHIDWSSLLRALESIRYRGPLSVEFVPIIERAPPHSAAAETGELSAAGYEAHAREALEFIRAHVAGRPLLDSEGE